MNEIHNKILNLLSNGELTTKQLHEELKEYSVLDRINAIMYLIDNSKIEQTVNGFRLKIN